MKFLNQIFNDFAVKPVLRPGYDLPNVNVTEDDDVEMRCAAYGDPRPSVAWYINGVPIDG